MKHPRPIIDPENFQQEFAPGPRSLTDMGLECRLLGDKRTSNSGGWMSACSQEEKLAGGIGIQSFAQSCHNTGLIPANCSWLKILRFGPYAHKQSVPSRGNGHRRLSVREEPWLSYA